MDLVSAVPRNLYIPGQRKFQCDRCGFVYLTKDMRREVLQAPTGGWSGRIVCESCWDPFQGQNLVGTEPPRERYDYENVRPRNETFPTGYPAPTLTSTTPGPTVSVAAFLASPTLSCTGTGYTLKSRIKWDGDAYLPTVLVSATQITAVLVAGFITAGVHTVQVENVPPPMSPDGIGRSDLMNLTVTP